MAHQHGPHHQDIVPELTDVEFWNQRYSEKDQIWSGKVNAALETVSVNLTPGTVLDVGCGEGGDSVWLAKNGWTVTGLDISEVALARAATAASEHGVADRITWNQLNLTKDSPEGTFDLVSAIFLQSPIGFPREEILRKLMQSVAPGGSLLVVGHAAWPPWSRHAEEDLERPAPPNASETLTSLAVDKNMWRVDIAEDWARMALGPDGEEVKLIDAVVLITKTKN